MAISRRLVGAMPRRGAGLWLRVGLASSLALSSAAAATAPRSLKLYYGDFPFWRAEAVRLTLFYGNVPFEDVRDQKRADMMEAGKLTFGALPVLEVDGQILSQTQAIATYAAKLSGLHPDDPWEAAKVDECLNGCTDVTGTIGQTFRLPDEEKLAAREKLIAPDGRLSLHMGGLEKICAENGACGYAVGEGLTVADFAIWRLVGWLSSGIIDGIPKSYVASTFPAVSKLVETVDATPKVGEWKALHSKLYAPK